MATIRHLAPVYSGLILICIVLIIGARKNSEEGAFDPSPDGIEKEEKFPNCKSHYRAAVVEYKPIPIGSQFPTEAVLSNVNEYVKLIKAASDQNADIIVFPEYGLTTVALPPDREQARKYFVSVPPSGTVPCNTLKYTNESSFKFNDEILQRLSCSARDSLIYVVVNLGEYLECQGSDCPTDGFYHFNTNVVFDRTGRIVGRYRKFHLYFEPQFNYPSIEYSTFHADFGVEFGLFTCFDIIFAHPAVELVAARGIRNFIFPTAWIDELPFLTAIQSQALWSQSNRANLLASGYHEPRRGSMGSGIYSGGETVNYVFNPNSGTKLVVGDVPLFPNGNVKLSPKPEPVKRIGNGSDTQSYHFWLREDLTNCSYKSLDPFQSTDLLCHDEHFCCEIEYDLISQEYSGVLKLLVFDGRRTVAAKRDWFEWQVCAVIHCLNDTIESCTENIKRRETEANYGHPKLQQLNIKARPLKMEYEQEDTSRPALSLLDTHFRLIPQSFFKIEQWRDQQGNNEHVVEAKSNHGSGLEEVDIKTIALIHKVYNGRV